MSRMQTMTSTSGSFGAPTQRDRSTTSPVESTAGLVHDLGNLIQIASAAVNIVARNPTIHTAGLELVVAGAKKSLERAGALVRQTIGMASERAAAVEQVSLAGCLAEVEVLIRTTWERSIQLDVQVNPDLPLVTCNPLALQNAVLNLLFNARDAMPGGGAISISAGAISLDSGVPGVEVRIADNGVGMRPDTIARALDPFFTTKCDGLGGIGLPMVDRFARDAGGAHPHRKRVWRRDNGDIATACVTTAGAFAHSGRSKQRSREG